MGLLLWVFFPLAASAQIPDSIAGPLTALAHRVEQFGKALPQEKVALHLDNTSYYQGDDIWFQCYVVASGLNRPTEWSKTLYVELLNPGGEIVSKQILPVRNGRCHGHFALTQLPFYSGFYEVRAYTKYMLNFDEASVFSRIIPVFDKPEVPGNYVEKEISPRVGKYPQERKRPRKEKKLNLRFYPEGGYLVKDVPVRVAFEATDAYGNPVDVSGRVVDKEGRECLTFTTGHEGKGSFTYTAGEGEGRAEVIWNEKRYRFDLPEAREQGFACSVDNLSSPDSLLVTVQKNARTPGSVLGMAVIGGGQLYLDRVFAPAPRMYPLAEMQVRVPGGEQKVAPSSDEQADTVRVEEDYNLFLQAYEDSLRRLGIDEKIHHLDEVEVKARKRDKASDVYQARTKSIAYYDVASEMDDIQDRNGFVGDDIHELMRNMNPDFYTQFSPSGEEYLFYKGRLALFVINYERTRHEEMDFNKYRSLTLESIKSIYISEDLGTMCRYADPRFTPMNIDKLYGCVVLIETKPEGEIPAKGAKGVRKTWLEGYSKVKEFYSPDYRVLPREEDYRRTLYWQPELMTDEQGGATVRFFNNSRCRYPRVTVNVLDSDGRIGSLEQ